MFVPLEKLIPKAAQTFGIAQEMKAAKICHDFRMVTPELFPVCADQITPAYYKNGTLVINVNNSALAQEVIMRKVQIIDKINEKAGKEVIKNLRTQLKNSQNNISA